MALGNWTGWVVTFPDEQVEGNLAKVTTKEGLTVESYKNWLCLAHPTLRTASYVPGYVGEIWSGAVQVLDLCVLAERGPNEGIYFACWDRAKTVCMIGVGCRNTDTGLPGVVEHRHLTRVLNGWLDPSEDLWSLDWNLPEEKIRMAILAQREALGEGDPRGR